MILELVTFQSPAGWDRARVLEDAAKRAHDAAWREAVRQRTGADPVIRYFDLLLLVDNEQGRVTEWAADGTARVLRTP